MIVGPSFGLGEKAAPRKRGDTPSPFTGRAGEGLAGKLLNITQASLVAVSQDAGESEGASLACGELDGVFGGFAVFWSGGIQHDMG